MDFATTHVDAKINGMQEIGLSSVIYSRERERERMYWTMGDLFLVIFWLWKTMK